MDRLLVLIAMIFCHIIDDYYLQGILASMKQKDWWQTNAPNPLYEYDYLMALFIHGFSWTCSIMLVPTIYTLVVGGIIHPQLFIINIILHMVIDDLKANRKKINLITDQSLHLLQIIVTWYCLMF